ncbi:MAG: ABC transporter permease [Elusimicrobia bacterium]|nr:ABC transporter permease [Elusimicrobiota bacterium]
MGLFLKLAWRNVFRNKRRTFIAGTAIGVGLASLIFTDALIIGMKDNMVKSATASFLGEGQIHKKGFRDTMETEDTINNLDTVVAGLKKESIVERFSVRTLAFGMITSPANVESVSVVGIDPEKEKYLSLVDDSIIQGSYFSGKRITDIVIGSKLAEFLEAGLGDRVVITVPQAKTGELSQDLFRISGIFKSGISELDKGIVLIDINKSRKMLSLKGRAHEIALKFTDIKYGSEEKNPFWAKYSRHGNEALGWTVILKDLSSALELTDFSVAITAAVLFGIVVFIIINTLFMSIYERMFEFGVIKAVGTRSLRVAVMIVYESCALALVSIVCGSALGYLATYIVSVTGINYSGIEFAGVTFLEKIYPVLTVKQFILYPVWVFLFTAVAGIYPGIYAARMSVVKAIRTTL